MTHGVYATGSLVDATADLAEPRVNRVRVHRLGDDPRSVRVVEVLPLVEGDIVLHSSGVRATLVDPVRAVRVPHPQVGGVIVPGIKEKLGKRTHDDTSGFSLIPGTMTPP
eukprot:CAMPEP_0196758504 /NCGR_PEP_ID=MMETSP1091-20130531/104214_1 /TAXON_ID=302021 /ORGANISM="Rhodomonas sp., Strain CCMP768" /LENGTH=109 /DNA_ID=CAMNT_0042107329 /DNA_START=360 /DNA_END=686 /DNA_ORIENTATION=+